MKYIFPFVGNDPELFITEKGKLVPAEKLIPEAEKNLYRGVKVDNAAVELNFPAQTCLQFNLGEIATTLKLLKEKLVTRVHKISLSPAMEVEPQDMRCKSLSQFGCSPSLVFEGDTLQPSRPNVDPREVRYRSIGYHVHLGFDKPKEVSSDWWDYNQKEKIRTSELLHTTDGRVRLVQACDYVAGLPAVLLERDDKAVQARRRLLGYGRAGEFREQPHGFEYRTLGPWPMIGPSWSWWANSAVRDALQLTLNDVDLELVKKIPPQKVSDAINSNDLSLALTLWTDIKRVLSDVITDKANGQHAILGKRNIRMFEFAIAKGGLKGKSFKFGSWRTTKQDTPHWIRPRRGFPYRMQRWVQSPNVLADYLKFCEKWSLAKDNLSQYI